AEKLDSLHVTGQIQYLDQLARQFESVEVLPFSPIKLVNDIIEEQLNEAASDLNQLERCLRKHAWSEKIYKRAKKDSDERIPPLKAVKHALEKNGELLLQRRWDVWCDRLDRAVKEMACFVEHHKKRKEQDGDGESGKGPAVSTVELLKKVSSPPRLKE
ncbi:unnamed protein product, partial [marine sediment metagenome]